MKTFKKLATLSMALMFTLGLGALTACKGDDTSTSSTPTSSSVTDSNSETSENKTYNNYEFIVLDKDGNKVGEGYNVQLCVVNPDGSLGACLTPIAVVNGVCKYTPVTAPGIYEVHLMEGYNPIEAKETIKTSADSFGEYTIQLAE